MYISLLPTGDCKTCQLTPDVLERCWSRLRTYEAISSPEYISQTSSDPILTAFELCSVFGAQAELHDGTFRVALFLHFILDWLERKSFATDKMYSFS